jgi:hypothetical protein
VNVIPASEGAVFGVSQCLEYDSISGEFEISGWVRMAFAGDPGIAPEALGTVRFFTGTGCDESTTGDETETNIVAGDTGGFWMALLANGTAPVDAASALISFVVERDDSPAGPDTFDANFDDLFFGAPRIIDPTIFDDGFESGDVSGWSASSP